VDFDLHVGFAFDGTACLSVTIPPRLATRTVNIETGIRAVMGFNVGTLAGVPLAFYDYYIFVLGDPERSGHARWIRDNFSTIARSLGGRAAIIAGTDQNLQKEIKSLLHEWSADWQDDVMRLQGASLFSFLAEGTTLLISHGDIRKTNNPANNLQQSWRFE
jgi:hypothetical protein